MKLQISDKTYDVDLNLMYNDGIEVVINSIVDEENNIVDLNTIDNIELKFIMRDYYQDFVKFQELEGNEFWCINRDLGDVRIINNTAILKLW